jgi:hypothetical protein
MIKKLHLLLALGFWLVTFTGFAQTYPVTISTQLTQPSPIYLSNYADATTMNSPIKIQLVLNDLTISNRQVRLKCYFQGNGISLVTNDFVVGARSLYLEGGFPLQLTNLELAPYFEFQNMLGINPNQYAQALPEGIYTFAVEVYDFATGKKLSRKTSVTTIIFQNDPPFLNLPLNDASIMQQNIQNIVFSWTPRQINVSNVEYEFSLVEIWDKYTPVQNAFAYSPALYTTTTRSTTLQYANTEPQLIPGKRYAWRVKAKAIFGAEEIGVFKNNGYSEIYSFTYEVFCTAPVGITTESVSQDKAKITWSGDIANYDYQVKYREKNAGSKWYDLVTPRENITISNLKPNATYEYTVGASCDLGKYVHSSIYEFTTLANDEIAFAGCGIKPDPKDLANKTPLPDLFPNDVVTAGDFPIVVLHSTGSNGSFSGDGYVTLPFLEKFKELIDAADALGGDKINIGKYTRIRITFNNIGVNTDFKLISGEIVASYDPDWGSMIDGDKILNDITGSDGKPIAGTIDYQVKYAVLNPDGSTTITGVNGQTTIIKKSVYDQVYTDNKGQTVTIPANGSGSPTIGTAAEGGKAIAANTNGMTSSSEVAQISSPDVTITFENGSNSKYAFDKQPAAGSEKLKATYETIPMQGGGVYKVNYKAVSDLNGSDVFIVEANFKNGKKKEDIVFKTNAGAKVDVNWISDTKAEITVNKTLNFGKGSIIATVKGAKEKDPKDATKTIEAKADVAGKVNVWELTQKPAISITLLSINGASMPNVKDAKAYLNDVYNTVGVKFDVTTQSIAIGSLPNEIQCGNSDILNVYTEGQNNIKNQIESNSNFVYNNETYYVIYTGKPAQNNYKGFMPLGGQYAFVFDNSLNTTAHELGHGIFGLKHPFSIEADSGKTDLLMDYGGGKRLSHNDWDIIHSGGWKFYGFQKSAGGALAGGYAIAPDWSFVSNGLEGTVKASGDSDSKGFLRGIVVNDVTYLWKLDSADGKSKYLNENSVPYTNPQILPKEDKDLIFLFFANQNSRGKYIKTVYKELASIIKSESDKDLSDFITKHSTPDLYTKGKDEKRNTYWGYVGCSNCDSNGVENGSNSAGLVVDKTAKISAEELQQLIAQVSTSNQVNGINAKIFITAKNDTKGIAEVEKAIADLEKSNIREIYIWAKNYESKDNFDIDLAYGKGLSSKEKLDFDNFETTIKTINTQKNSWLACLKLEGTYNYFNPLTAMLDGLAGLIGKAAIPEKYFNPDEPDYNPLPAKIYAYASGTIITEINNNNQYRASRVEFALVCGVWNGLIGTVEAIPAGASMILKIQGSAIDVVINHQGSRDKLINTISKINKEQIGQLLSTINDEIEKGYKKYTSNPCMISYSSGQGIFVVVSLFVGAGQANGAKTFLQTLEKLDVAGQLIGKVFRIGGKLVKPILNPISKKIKFALAEGVQFAQRIEFKLPNNLYCGIPYLEIKLRDRLKTLTANEIKKLEDDIARQLNDPTIPVDENGNKLLELDIDGEKVPAVLGTNEGLDKIDDGVSVQGAGSLDDLVSWASKNGLSNLTQAEIKGTFELFDGNISFAQKALLSSKEIVAGKTLPELAQHFNLPTIPSAQSLTPYQARVWYSWRKSQISTLVNRSNGLEAAAREALEMRNTIRTTTRNSMKDTDIANFLNTKEVNMTWEEAMSKYNSNYEEIIQASMRGRGVVDVLFQIPK